MATQIFGSTRFFQREAGELLRKEDISPTCISMAMAIKLRVMQKNDLMKRQKSCPSTSAVVGHSEGDAYDVGQVYDEDYQAPLNDDSTKKKKTRSKRRNRSKDRPPKSGGVYYDLQIPAQELQTPVSAISLDDDTDWFEALHNEKQQHANTDDSNPEELLTALEAALDKNDHKPFKTPQMKKDPVWVEGLEREAKQKDAKQKRTRKQKGGSSSSTRSIRSEETRQRSNKVLRCKRADESVVSKRDEMSVGQMETEEIEDTHLERAESSSSVESQLTTENDPHEIVSELVASSEWDGHQQVLNNWRDFVKDKRRGRFERVSDGSRSRITKHGQMRSSIPLRRHSGDTYSVQSFPSLSSHAEHHPSRLTNGSQRASLSNEKKKYEHLLMSSHSKSSRVVSKALLPEPKSAGSYHSLPSNSFRSSSYRDEKPRSRSQEVRLTRQTSEPVLKSKSKQRHHTKGRSFSESQAGDEVKEEKDRVKPDSSTSFEVAFSTPPPNSAGKTAPARSAVSLPLVRQLSESTLSLRW